MNNKLLKVMTFNLRVDVKGDGINSYTNRFSRVLDTVVKEDADIIGFQEVTESMRARLEANLTGYTFVGCGREKNYNGESMLIIYKTSDFQLVSLENLWLSPTPKIPGSNFGGDQSSCPRMMTAVYLKHNEIEKPFCFINTHLDHAGETARYLGSMEIVQYISQHSENFVLTGDFNATPDAKEIKLITNALSYRGCVDCTEKVGGTFHDFGRLGNKAIKIDYIFTDAKCVRCEKVEDIPVNGQYYSDHNAVCAWVKI